MDFPKALMTFWLSIFIIKGSSYFQSSSLKNNMLKFTMIPLIDASILFAGSNSTSPANLQITRC